MRTTLLLLLIVLGFAFGSQLAPAWATHDGSEAICDTAAVIACENFENRSVGIAQQVLADAQFKNVGWGMSDAGMTVVSGQSAFGGSKAFAWNYGVNQNAGYTRLRFMPSGTDRYWRFYMKNSANWVWSSNGNKMMFSLEASGKRVGMFDQGTQDSATKNVPMMDFLFQTPNLGFMGPNTAAGSFQWPLNQWVCVEEHEKLNSTPNATDGVWEAWINGVNYYNYPNINLTTSDPSTPITDIQPSGYWNCYIGTTDANGFCITPHPLSEHPAMQRWMDNIVVSTQRIGCLGATGDISPPTIPVGLRIN